MRFVEGRAWFDECPVQRCSKGIIEAHVEGLKLRLDTKAVPYKDSLILAKYDRLMVNVWVGATQLYANAWFAKYGRPDKGHIYTQHVHGRRL